MSEMHNELLVSQQQAGAAAPAINTPARPTGRKGGGVAWMVLTALIWGTVGVSSALLNRIEVTPPLMIAFLRLAFAAPMLVGLAWVTTRRNPFRLSGREWLYYGSMGLAMAIYQITYFLAIPISSVTLVVVVALCSSPLIVALLSIPIFQERLTGALALSLALALTGTVLLSVGGGSEGEWLRPEYALGTLLALGTGLAYSVLVIFSKLAQQTTERGPVQPVAVAFSLGAVVILPVALLTGSFKLELAGGVWLVAAYLGVIPTGLAYIIFLKGIKTASATAATLTTMLEPAVAAFLAFALLGEKLTLYSLAGSVLLLVSVLVQSKR